MPRDRAQEMIAPYLPSQDRWNKMTEAQRAKAVDRAYGKAIRNFGKGRPVVQAMQKFNDGWRVQ